MVQTQTVEEFLSKLSHRRIEEVRAVRKILLSVDPGVTEKIKWNAPSFCWQGDDRITMRLQPDDRLDFIFHRGAKAKETSTFGFDDPSGLIEWRAVDRGVLPIRNPEAERIHLTKLAKAWFAATTQSD